MKNVNTIARTVYVTTIGNIIAGVTPKNASLEDLAYRLAETLTDMALCGVVDSEDVPAVAVALQDYLVG